jgi:hypothetical protein
MNENTNNTSAHTQFLQNWKEDLEKDIQNSKEEVNFLHGAYNTAWEKAQNLSYQVSEAEYNLLQKSHQLDPQLFLEKIELENLLWKKEEAWEKVTHLDLLRNRAKVYLLKAQIRLDHGPAYPTIPEIEKLEDQAQTLQSQTERAWGKEKEELRGIWTQISFHNAIPRIMTDEEMNIAYLKAQQAEQEEDKKAKALQKENEEKAKTQELVMNVMTPETKEILKQKAEKIQNLVPVEDEQIAKIRREAEADAYEIRMRIAEEGTLEKAALPPIPNSYDD